MRLYKKARYSVQIMWWGNGRSCLGVINLGEGVARRNKEIEWMFQLTSVYPYCLNQKMEKIPKLLRGYKI